MRFDFTEDQIKMINNALNMTSHTYRMNGSLDTSARFRELQDEVLRQWAEQEEE